MDGSIWSYYFTSNWMPPKSLTLTLLIFLQHMRKTYESKVFAISLIQILACFIQSSDVFVFKNSGNLFVVASLYPSPSSRFSWFVLFFEIHRQTWHNQKINEHRTLFSCVWIYPVWMNRRYTKYYCWIIYLFAVSVVVGWGKNIKIDIVYVPLTHKYRTNQAEFCCNRIS